jgi:membrane protease YdiL (CAAX protease family)
MAVLTLAGLFGAVLYLRTRNLLVVTGIHALVNAPTPLVATPASPFGITLALSAALWIAWPHLDRRAPTRPD